MSGIGRHVRSNVIGYLALFIALGGVSYAAVQIPRNSVGSAQIKKNAVRSSDVKNGALTAKDFKAGQLPAGAQGLKGDTGAQGPKGDTGAQGPKGERGPSTAYAEGSAGYQAITADGTILESMQLPPGRYYILAKAGVNNNDAADARVECTLMRNGVEIDSSMVSVEDNTQPDVQTVSLQSPVSAPNEVSNVSLVCIEPAGQEIIVGDRKIAAIEVADIILD